MRKTKTGPTDAVDSHSSLSASIGVFITLVRQIWGFIGPFWFPYMFNSAGLKGSTGIVVAIIIAVAVLPVTLLQLKGYEWREGKREQSEDGKRE